MGMRTAANPAVAIRPMSIAQLREQGGALLKAHYDEVAKNKDVMVLDPDWDRYEVMERGGVLVSVGAFGEDGGLLGYSVGFLTTHLHYRGLTYYQNDVLFLAPDARRSRLGLRLIAASEEAAVERGARFVCWHAKQGTALDALLAQKGYGVQDIIYSRRV